MNEKILDKIEKYIKEERYLEAAELLEENIGSFNEDLTLYLKLGNLYVESGFLPDAIKAYKKAIKLAPDNDEVWHLYGIALFFFRKTDEAVEALEKAYSINPQDNELIKNLAVGYFYQKEFEKALTYLRLAASRGYPVSEETMQEFESYYFNNIE